ncbi:RepB family DNA primase [Methylobacterium sp. J-030]|uniref:DNA-primase RepB domain-containing protein n=1 Tax=Methylobacterium sp. J-030 TaxID=2836627 RepID=UPI001FBAE0D1|nr:DNA-primase RepB domain-containing protein [Methylobacterium sp. J-030]MCJ2068390.1 RepB family DNA primase [Methylobacterium sp. J-030]
MNAQAPLVADRTVVRTFVERINAHVATATAGMGDPGMLQLVVVHPSGGSTLAFQFAIGETEHMIDEAVRQSNGGHNVYFETRTVRRRARNEKGRGTIADTIAAFGSVADDDADKGKGSRIDAVPSLIIESSPGNTHRWFLLKQAIRADRAARIGASIKAIAGGDSDTGVVTQPFRVPGTVNYPGKAKVARGRIAVQTGIISLDGPLWTADELEAAFPAPKPKAKPRPNASFEGETGSTGRTSSEAEALLAEVDVPKRWPQLLAAAKAAYADGLSPDDFEALVRRYPEGCGSKFLIPQDRLHRVVGQTWARVQAKDDGAAQEPADPTYPDQRAPLSEAESEIRNVITDFFGRHVPAWRAELKAWERAHALWKGAHEAWEEENRKVPDEAPNKPVEPEKPSPVALAARVEPGIGKSALTIHETAEASRAGIVTVYAAPNHQLLTELAGRFAAEGVEARIYRGYDAEDPDAPGLKMCLDPEAAQDARDAGATVATAVCKRKVDGLEYRCAFIDRCGMEQQRNANAAVWLVPHSLLGHQKPAFIPSPDAIVIDEGVVLGALPDKPARMTLDAIERASVELPGGFKVFTNFANDLTSARGNLLRALRAHPEEGPLQRELLARHGVTRALAASAYKMEWDRKREPNILPGMQPKARKASVAVVGQHNAEIRLLAGSWAELRDFLAGDAAASGRLSLRYDPEAEARVLERRSLDAVVSSWSAPVLAIDATLPEASLLEPVIGQRVEIRADITARWSEHVTARQILGSPTTASKLGIVEGQQPPEPKRIVHYLLRLIRLRAALAWPGVVAVIAPKRLIEILKGLGLPPNVETGHYGGIAGIDRWRDAAGLITIGRLQPGPPIAEGMAGVVSGRVPERIRPDAEGRCWYPKAEAGVRLADGSGVRVETERHPDPVAEALRAQVTEAQLIQAVGRIRPLRRTAETPAFVDIITDVPLPVSIDRAVAWKDALPGGWADMAPAGVILESETDIMAAFPDLAPTRKAARENTVATMALFSIRDTLIGFGAKVATVFAYKRQGRAEPASGYLLPNRPSDLWRWLTDRVGLLEWLTVDGQPVAPPGEGVALDSPADMAAAWPARWATAAAARDWRARNGGMKLDGTPSPFRYQRVGRAQKWRTGAHDPAALPDLRAWLESRLGTLVGFEVEQPAQDAQPEPAAPAAPPMPFLPPRPILASNPAAKSADLVGTLGRWLELVGRPVAAETREGMPFSPVAAFA